MKWNRSLLIATGLMLLLGIVMLALGPDYRLSHVQPELRSLSRPYREVRADVYFDEGSIGLEVVDRGGKRQNFILPVRYEYQRLYIGARYFPGAATVPLNEDSKRYLLEMMEESEHGRVKDGAIGSLRRVLQNDFLYHWRCITGGD